MKKLFLILLSTMHFLGATTEGPGAGAPAGGDSAAIEDPICLFRKDVLFSRKGIEGENFEECYRNLCEKTGMKDYFNDLVRLTIGMIASEALKASTGLRSVSVSVDEVLTRGLDSIFNASFFRHTKIASPRCLFVICKAFELFVLENKDFFLNGKYDEAVLPDCAKLEVSNEHWSEFANKRCLVCLKDLCRADMTVMVFPEDHECRCEIHTACILNMLESSGFVTTSPRPGTGLADVNIMPDEFGRAYIKCPKCGMNVLFFDVEAGGVSSWVMPVLAPGQSPLGVPSHRD